MLVQRIVTAVVLLAILIPALLATAAWPFALITLVLIGAAGWEWARLNGSGGAAAKAWGVGLAAAGGLAWPALSGGTAFPALSPLWDLALVLWVIGGALALRAGVPAWPRVAAPARLGVGLLLLAIAGLALMVSRARGLNYLMSVFCLVWVADVAAYFGGKAFGRRKLALGISPGKSWEGAWTGLAGVLVLAFAWSWADARFAAADPSLFSLLVQRGGPAALVLGALFLGALSIVGDLFESLVKRSAGAKDSSALLPGHGGVLDRIDALLPVLPLALAIGVPR
jgi:phosphatidate cytidylyltransferase